MRRAYLLLWFKAALVLTWATVSYLVLLFFVSTRPWAASRRRVSLGLAAAGIGFTIMHDANHMAFAPRRWINRVMALSLDLIGGSSYVWSAKHLAHHSYTNVTDHDPDIDSLPLARFDPAQERRPWHRYQHIYIWALYTMVTVRWQFMSDFSFLVKGRAGQMKLRPPKGRALWTFDRRQDDLPDLGRVIPVMLPPVAVGGRLSSSPPRSSHRSRSSLVFQLAHCVEEAEFIDPEHIEDGPHAWQVHQVETTVDFAKGNSLLRFYAGGLNHQIEHHLYSRLPHTLYPRIAPIVEAAAKTHGITYTHHPTLRIALRSHTRWLKLMAAAPHTAPATAPVTAEPHRPHVPFGSCGRCPV